MNALNLHTGGDKNRNPIYISHQYPKPFAISLKTYYDLVLHDKKCDGGGGGGGGGFPGTGRSRVRAPESGEPTNRAPAGGTRPQEARPSDHSPLAPRRRAAAPGDQLRPRPKLSFQRLACCHGPRGNGTRARTAAMEQVELRVFLSTRCRARC